jgi:hypothetical protein
MICAAGEKFNTRLETQTRVRLYLAFTQKGNLMG